jgi:ubiquinone/menaquinone biosynthesis C-methylase UbiE
MERDEDLGAVGFSNGPLYDSSRPDYPVDALEYFVSSFGLSATSRVLDLGAGTGIFTRQMLPYVGTMTAVDPSESMREALQTSTQDVEVLEGSDIDIPLGDESVDVVFVAQAFHWFNAPRALEEIHRVLKPNGGLGLIWNERDESVDWVLSLSRAMQWDTKQPYDVGADFTEIVASGPFKDIERVTFAHSQTLSREGLLRRVLSTSYISTMMDEQRDLLMSDVIKVVEKLAQPIVLPYNTTAYSARAVSTLT